MSKEKAAVTTDWIHRAKARRLAAMSLLIATALAASLTSGAVAQAPDLIGEYRVTEGPDVGGGLVIAPDGSFQYGLFAGALDEHAEGRWERSGDAICLFTEPKPVPPAFEKGEPVDIDGAQPTILVTWPDGSGVTGVTFTIGFDSGDPIEDYTQDYGWTMPEGDTRVPRWIDIREPIYDIVVPRYDLNVADGGRLHVRLIPNDMGVYDFNGACVTESDDGIVLRRPDGELRFARIRDGSE